MKDFRKKIKAWEKKGYIFSDDSQIILDRINKRLEEENKSLENDILEIKSHIQNFSFS